MQLTEILTTERISLEADATSKKRALEALSGLLSAGSAGAIEARAVFDCLLGRERLGSTGLGYGVAIPHGRHAALDRVVGAFVKLTKPVDFDALDGRPVDLLFGLLVPEAATDEHLQILAELAERFSDAELRRRLRESESTADAYELLTQTIHQT